MFWKRATLRIALLGLVEVVLLGLMFANIDTFRPLSPEEVRLAGLVARLYPAFVWLTLLAFVLRGLLELAWVDDLLSQLSGLLGIEESDASSRLDEAEEWRPPAAWRRQQPLNGSPLKRSMASVLQPKGWSTGPEQSSNAAHSKQIAGRGEQESVPQPGVAAEGVGAAPSTEQEPTKKQSDSDELVACKFADLGCDWKGRPMQKGGHTRGCEYNPKKSKG